MAQPQSEIPQSPHRAFVTDLRSYPTNLGAVNAKKTRAGTAVLPPEELLYDLLRKYLWPNVFGCNHIPISLDLLYRVHRGIATHATHASAAGAKIPGRCLALLCSVFIVRQLRTNSPPCGEPRLSSFLGSPPLWTSTTVPPLPLPALRAVAHTHLVLCTASKPGPAGPLRGASRPRN